MNGVEQLAAEHLYASAVSKHKDLGVDQEAAARTGIHLALRRLYRAVAVDIDGTLTAADGADLDRDVAGSLKAILGRGIPVILVTGRGAESAGQAMDALQSRRRDQSPGRLHCLIRNGASVLEPVLGASGDRRYGERPLGEPLDSGLWDEITTLAVPPDHVRPAAASEGEAVYAIRLEYGEQSWRDSAYEELGRRLGARGIAVTTSQYRDVHTINLTRITKMDALTMLAAELGLEPDEVLRIGDQGQPGGNDADLLDAVGGFSVGLVSSVPDRCHPVVGGDGSVHTGAQATLALLNGVVLSPPIKRIDSAVDAEVIRRLGMVERRARAGAEGALENIGAAVARSLAALVDDGNGLSGPSRARLPDVYDPLSGAVRLRDFEVNDLQAELADDHPAEQLFGLKNVFEVPPKGPLVMASDTGVLLRGAYYYAGLISEPSSSRIREFFSMTTTVVTQGIEVLNALAAEPPSLTRFKLVLGIADHVRNGLLQVVHLAWKMESRDEQYVLLPWAVHVAREHTGAHVKLILRNDERWRDALKNYAVDLAVIQDALAGLAGSELGDLDELHFPKALIRDRESDHFLTNAAAVMLALEGHRGRMALRRGAHVTCYGLPYGGVELPLLASVLGEELDLDVAPAYLHSSTYEDKALGDKLRSTKTRSVDELSDTFPRWLPNRADNETVLIADDNTTTAVTLQLAIDLLAVQKIDADGAIMVQYPSSNRREHMRLEGHGCVDPDALLGFIRGLIEPTPYSRLLKRGEGADLYRDYLKVFNKSKKRIERLLMKAGLMEPEPDEPPSGRPGAESSGCS